jgi:hypothetical protein
MSEIKKDDLFAPDVIQPIFDINKGLKEMIDSLDGVVKSGKALNDSFKAQESVVKMKKDVEELSLAEKELEKVTKQIEVANARSNEEYKKKQAELLAVRKAQQEENAEAKRAVDLQGQSARALNAQNASLKQLKAALAQNRAEYSKLSAAERDNAKIGGELLKTIQEQDKGVKQLSDSVGDMTPRVGSYKQAIQESLGPLGAFGGMIIGAPAAIGDKVRALATLRTAMMALPIFAIIGAITAMVQWFKRTEEGAQQLRIIMAAVNQVFDFLLDYVTDIGEALATLSLDQVKQGFKDMGDAVQNFVISRFELLLGAVSGFGEALNLLFEGEFKAAAQTAGKAFIDLTRATNPVAMIIEGIIDNAPKIGSALSDAYQKGNKGVQRAIELQEMENQLIQDKRKFISREIELSAAIAEARERSVDQTLTLQQRLDSVLEAERLIKVEATEREALAERELFILVERAKISKTDETTLQKIAELEAEVLNIQIKRREEGRRLVSQRTGFIKAIEEEERKALLAAAKAEEDRLLDSLNAQKRQLEEITNKIKTEAIIGLITREEAEAKLLKARKRISQEMIENSIETFEQILEIENLSADERKKVEEDLYKHKQMLIDQHFSYLEKKENADLERQKELADLKKQIMQETYDTFAMVGNSFFNRRIELLNQDMEAERRSLDEKLANLEGNEEAQNFARARSAAKQEELRKEQIKQERKQAVFNKAVAIGDIIFNTARGVTKAAAASPITFGLPWSAFIIGLGVAQSAAVLAQPLPAFADGVFKLNGDGTERSDSILARLSKNESVVPAHKTREFGSILKPMIEKPNFRMADLYGMLGLDMPASKMGNIFDGDKMIKELQGIKRGVMETKSYTTYLDGRKISKNSRERDAIREKVIRRNRF